MTPPESTPAARPARSRHWRVAALTGASLVLVGGAAVTMAASPAPSGTPDPTTGTQLEEGTPPSRDDRGLWDGFAGGAGRHGGFGGGAITITGIDGSSLTLETVDGWTRTIEVTSETEISKDGEAADAGDLEVGDRVRFRQAAVADTYEITDLVVVQPTVVGRVTARDDDSITIEQRDGASVTVNVDDSTEFTVGGETGKSLSDVEVGMILGAAGELNDDGSLNATKVAAGAIGDGPFRGHRHGPFGDDGPADPTATPEDDSSTSAS